MKWMTKLKEAVRARPEKREVFPAESESQQAPSPVSGDARLATLTPREREVFELLIQGKKMREVAEALGVKLTTVSFHSTALYKKLDVHDRPQLILRYGFAEGTRDTPTKREESI